MKPLDIEAVKQEVGHLVKNIKRGEHFQVRADQKTKWGNPFRLIVDTRTNRRLLLHRYYGHLQECVRNGKLTVEEIAALADKTLGCHCSPLDCHCHILAWAARRCREFIRRKAA